MRSRAAWSPAVHFILALAALVMIVPLVWIILTAFKERNEVFSQVPQWLPAQPTFGNFFGVLDAMPFWQYYWNTIVVAFGLLALQLVTVTWPPMPSLEWSSGAGTSSSSCSWCNS